MRKTIVAFSAFLVSCLYTVAQTPRTPQPRINIPVDSIRLSDPFILADAKTNMYYMTGTGGLLWKSRDLSKWDGPYRVTQTDSSSWMGPAPMIWAAEIHAYNNRYYYFGTFTNRAVFIDTVDGTAIERRACHILVSDKPEGPYTPMGDPVYLPANMPTLDGTLWIENGQPYLVYCYEWLQNRNGTIESIALKPDLSGTTGKSTLLFRAKDAPWSREKNADGTEGQSKVTDGPYLFKTGTGRLGMIWTSWIHDVYTQGVAYSTTGLLNGPWVHGADPITPPNFGHGMLFHTFEGKLLMALHSHKSINGRYIRFPKFFEVDVSGDKLSVKQPYNP
jgi:hypothetical protein